MQPQVVSSNQGVGDSAASIEWGIGDSVTFVPREARPPRTSDIDTGSPNISTHQFVCVESLAVVHEVAPRFSCKSDLGISPRPSGGVLEKTATRHSLRLLVARPR